MANDIHRDPALANGGADTTARMNGSSACPGLEGGPYPPLDSDPDRLYDGIPPTWYDRIARLEDRVAELERKAEPR